MFDPLRIICASKNSAKRNRIRRIIRQAVALHEALEATQRREFLASRSTKPNMRFAPLVSGRLSLSQVPIAFSGRRLDKEVMNQPTPAQSTPVAQSSPAAAAAAQTILTQLPTSVRPLHYAIAVIPGAAANLRFSGTVAIDIDVLQPTDSITLNAAAMDSNPSPSARAARRAWRSAANLRSIPQNRRPRSRSRRISRRESTCSRSTTRG